MLGINSIQPKQHHLTNIPTLKIELRGHELNAIHAKNWRKDKSYKELLRKGLKREVIIMKENLKYFCLR